MSKVVQNFKKKKNLDNHVSNGQLRTSQKGKIWENMPSGNWVRELWFFVSPVTKLMFKHMCPICVSFFSIKYMIFMLQIHFDRLSRQLQSNLLAFEHFSHDCICLDLQLWNDGATLGGILGHIGTGWTNIFLYNSEVSGLSLSHFTPDGRT